mgnify:CR=1 FL=1
MVHGTYASQTSVDPGRSRAEIESTLARYGASAFGYATEDDGHRSRAAITFIAHGRQIRFFLEMPSRHDRVFTHTEARGTPRSPDAAQKAWEQAVRQRWRALALMVKAKLEAVEAQIVTFESEFLAHTVLPGTSMTVAEYVEPELARAIEEGKPARMLELPRGKRDGDD